MQLVYKIVSGSPSSPAVVGDTNFPSHYAGVNANMAWGELTTAIRQATDKFVLPFVGEEIYNDLAAKFQGGTSLTTEQTRALVYLQDCIAAYSIYHVLPEKTTAIASMGAMQNTSSDGGGNPAPQWAWKGARQSALDNADTYLDQLLAYLEKQVAAGVAYFDLWKNSAAYKSKTSAFFRRTAELDEFLNIQSSRRSFISLVKFMSSVEEDVVAPILCATTFDALKASNLTTANANLLKKVRKAVAYLGLAEAIPHHRVVVDGEGFRFVSSGDGFDDRRNMTNTTHMESIERLRVSSSEKGKKALEELQGFLVANADTYPDWKNSTCNQQKAKSAHSIRQSPDGKGAVGVF